MRIISKNGNEGFFKGLYPVNLPTAVSQAISVGGFRKDQLLGGKGASGSQALPVTNDKLAEQWKTRPLVGFHPGHMDLADEKLFNFNRCRMGGGGPTHFLPLFVEFALEFLLC
jgi:hypothetical protein